MGDVIQITLHRDLGNDLLNELRTKMELARWKQRWRKAKREKDFDMMDHLDREYEYIGLP